MAAIHAENFTDELYKRVNTGILRGNYLRHRTLTYSDDKTERQYSIYNRRGRLVVEFRARPLPGCCGVLVVYYLRPAHDAKEPQKVFTDTLSLIAEAAGLAKFGSVLLTQTQDSSGFRAFTSSGWHSDLPVQPEFTNWKTGSRVSVFMILTKAPPEAPKRASFSGE